MKHVLTMTLMLATLWCHAQVKIGDNPTTVNPNAVLELESTQKAFLPPRMTTDQRDAITNLSIGLMIINTDNNCLEYYNGSSWVSTCAGSVNGTGTPDCNAATLNGIYQVGLAMSGSNYVTIPVQVATAGSWTASTNTVNGVSFSGGGVFSQPGVVSNIVLYASPGVLPNFNGDYTYTLTLGGATCNFTVPFSSLPGCTSPTPALSFASPNTNSWALSAGTSKVFSVVGGTTNSTSFTYSIVPSTGVSAPTGNVTAGNTPSITFSNAGNYTITFTSTNAGSGNCSPASINISSSFEVVSGPELPSATVCATNDRISHTNLPTSGSSFTATIDGVPVSITRTGTIASQVINIAGTCGTPINSTTFLLTNGQTATFTFDQPISNIQVFSAMNIANDRMTFTAFNGFTNVSNQLVLSKLGTCPNTTTLTANNAIQLNANGSNNVGVSIGGVYYTSLTITFSGTDAQFDLGVCQGASNSCQAPAALNVSASATSLYGAIVPGNNTVTFNATGGTPNTSGITWSVSPTTGVTSATSGTGTNAVITWNNLATGKQYTVTFTATNEGTGGCTPVTVSKSSTVNMGVFTKALDIKAQNPAAPSGTYMIDPDGTGASFAPMEIYCDMVNDGGAWMLIAVSNGFTNLSESSTIPTLTGNRFLPRATVRQLANNCSDVTMRNSATHNAPFTNKLISNNSNPITRLRNSSTAINGAGTWDGISSSWTVTGSYSWTRTCTGSANGWPKMYHSCNNVNGVTILPQIYGIRRKFNSADGANSIWIR